MKQKKGRIIFICILVLLIAAAGVLAYFAPVLRAAVFLRDRMDLERFTYELEVELDKDLLSEDQTKALDTLAQLVGAEAEDMYRLTVKGSADGDIIHANIYPRGSKLPILELYLDGDDGVINAASLYSSIRDHLAQQSQLLAALLPVWEENGYLTIEQTEQLLGVDLSVLRNFKLQIREGELSFGKLVFALTAMDRTENDKTVTFKKSLETVDFALNLCYDEEPGVEIRFSAEEPAKLMGEALPVLSKAGWEAAVQIPESVESISLKLYPGQGEALSVPEDLVNQKLLDLIESVRELMSL